MKVYQKEKVALRKKCNFVLRHIAKWLHEDFDRQFNMKLREIDFYRLYNVWIWSERYKLSIRQILQVLVPYWSKRFKRRKGKAWGLGVKLHTFAGKHSQRKLEEYVAEAFPTGENFALAKQKRKFKLLGLAQRELVKSRSIVECKTIEEFVRKYGRRVGARRKELDKAEQQQSRKRRPYRGNPWL